jgi:hypothetical protein
MFWQSFGPFFLAFGYGYMPGVDFKPSNPFDMEGTMQLCTALFFLPQLNLIARDRLSHEQLN